MGFKASLVICNDGFNQPEKSPANPTCSMTTSPLPLRR